LIVAFSSTALGIGDKYIYKYCIIKKVYIKMFWRAIFPPPDKKIFELHQINENNPSY